MNDGDEVIVFEPFFDFYLRQVQMAHAKVIGIPFLLPEVQPKDGFIQADEWKVDYDLFEKSINEKTKIVVLTNPTNPFGKVFTHEELVKMNEILKKKNPKTVILSDEGNFIFIFIFLINFYILFFVLVYERIYFDDKVHTHIAKIVQEDDRLVTVFSIGKLFSCTGWKIG